MRKKNVVVIGGGTGTYTALTGLKKYPVNLSAVVAMADNGGSTKVLREEFGVLPPGSVRPALVALSSAEEHLADLLNYRFEEGSNGLSGHNLGNLIITALSQKTGSFERALEEAGKILNIKGQVIPSTLESCHLYAELENGKIVKGEDDIDVPKHDGKLRVKKVWLETDKDAGCKANPKAIKAVKEADLVVIGPGDMFTSILPNLLATGLSEALKKSKGKKVYVCNLMTKFGETNGYTVKDFADTLEAYLGKGVLDYVLVNTKKPPPSRVKKYEKEQAEPVAYNKAEFKDVSYTIVAKDVLRSEGFIRHDSQKLARAVISLI